MRNVAPIFFLLVMVLAGPVFAEPLGFVIEAVMATPEADSPIEADTAIDIEDNGHILIILVSGQITRKDGPFHGKAASLLNTDEAPGDEDLDNGILSSLLELAEVSRKSTEQLGGVRGVERRGDVHANAITAATRIFCLAKGDAPGFYASNPPRRDEPLIMRLRASPRTFFQATWPVGEPYISWPADWPLPEEGRYIWTYGSEGPAALWLRLIDNMPDNMVKRAALFNDLRCYTQAIALIRQIMAAASIQ